MYIYQKEYYLNVSGKLYILIFILVYGAVNHYLLGRFFQIFKGNQAHDNLGILSKFMMNKPPGRRLVIADINNSFVICWHVMTFSFYSSLLMRTFFGYLSYNIIFVFIEMIKISMFLSFAILNVSSFLQISLILNSRTIHVDDKEDKQNK